MTDEWIKVSRMKDRDLDIHTAKAIHEALSAGRTAPEIVAEFQVTRMTVFKIRQGLWHDLPRVDRMPNPCREDRDLRAAAIHKALLAGRTTKDVASEFRVSRPTVYRVRKGLWPGLPRIKVIARPHREDWDVRASAIHSALSAGRSTQEVVTEFNVTAPTVRKIRDGRWPGLPAVQNAMRRKKRDSWR